MNHKEWDGRESKAITLAGAFAAIDPLFPDGVQWSIVSEDTIPVIDEAGNPVLDAKGEPTYTTEQAEFDNSAFCIRGDITVLVDGTCTVEMGKPTDLEAAYEMIYGGVA